MLLTGGLPGASEGVSLAEADTFLQVVLGSGQVSCPSFHFKRLAALLLASWSSAPHLLHSGASRIMMVQLPTF
jgi:hypothetical protein